MNKKLVIFDLDGTLLHSRPTVAKILNQMRVDDGKKEIHETEFTPWLSLGGKALISNALEIESAIYALDKKQNEFRARYFEIKHTNSDFYDGSLEFIKKLIGANVQVTLCTNKPRKLVEKILQETEFGHYFDRYCSGGDVQHAKPHIHNLIKCKELFEVELKDMILLGDSKIDQQLCQAAQIPFVFHEYGYDDGVNQNQVSHQFKKYSELSLNLN